MSDHEFHLLLARDFHCDGLKATLNFHIRRYERTTVKSAFTVLHFVRVSRGQVAGSVTEILSRELPFTSTSDGAAN